MRQNNTLAGIRTFIVDIVGRFSFDSLAMYTLALASELPVILIRATLVYLVVGLKLAIQGHGDDPPGFWLEISLIPTFWSILALASPYGTGWWWKQRSGGRKPSQREQLAYNDSIELLQAQTHDPLPLPENWFVIDTPTPDAAVCGETLMLSRGLLESDHLPAVLAHELGHLATPDGKLTAAINRLVLIPPRPPRREQANHEPADNPRPEIEISNERIVLTLLAIRILSWIVRKTLKFINGGFGLWLTSPIWGAYWRRREYKADAYAARLGQADELADFLEVHALIHDHPVPYIWLTEHTHPPVELRLDKLRSTAQGEIADRSEPVKGTPTGPPTAGPDGLPLTEP
jgi:Zn-dependent protease with chaperone function